jgi:hypothetical protein
MDSFSESIYIQNIQMGEDLDLREIQKRQRNIFLVLKSRIHYDTGEDLDSERNRSLYASARLGNRFGKKPEVGADLEKNQKLGRAQTSDLHFAKVSDHTMW